MRRKLLSINWYSCNNDIRRSLVIYIVYSSAWYKEVVDWEESTDMIGSDKMI